MLSFIFLPRRGTNGIFTPVHQSHTGNVNLYYVFSDLWFWNAEHESVDKFHLSQIITFGDMIMYSFPSFPLQTFLHFVNKGHHSMRVGIKV